MSTMTFQFLDVGMGDGTLVQLRPTGQTYDTLILVDFGEEKSQFKIPLLDALTYLRLTIDANSKLRGAPTPFIDYLFITHSDADHHNKMSQLWAAEFPSFPDKELRFGKVYFGGKATEYGTLISDLEKRSDSVSPEFQSAYHSPVGLGNTVAPDFTFNDIRIYILSVNYPSITAKTNPKSIVLMFELGTYKVILQGDAEEMTETAIRGYFKDVPNFLESFALKLGHHGSKNGTSDKWVEAVKPKAIFASGDFNWAHPYCVPICRVLNKNTLGSYPDLWYCCGNASQYYNNHHSKAVCMNLWYYVKSDPGEYLIVFPKQTIEWAQKGLTVGVQWALVIKGDEKPDLFRTDAVIPYDVLKIPPGWDCATV